MIDGHISLTDAIKHNLINSQSVYGFPHLANKGASQNLFQWQPHFKFVVL